MKIRDWLNIKNLFVIKQASHYQHLSIALLATLFVIPSSAFAENWGGLKREGCNGTGVARYSAVLWNIPWGKSWEASCKATALMHKGIPHKTIECVNENGVKMWGKFNLPDPSCKLDNAFLEEIYSKVKLEAPKACYKAALGAREKYRPTDGCSNPLVDPATFAYRDVFFPACVIHDACYTTPNASQNGCDLMFQKGMHRLCETQGFLSTACHISADVWYTAVSLKGKPAYDKNQAAIKSNKKISRYLAKACH